MPFFISLDSCTCLFGVFSKAVEVPLYSTSIQCYPVDPKL